MADYDQALINEEGGLFYTALDHARRAHILGGPDAVEVTALYDRLTAKIRALELDLFGVPA